MLKLAITKDACSFLKGLESKQFKQVTNKVFSLLSDPRPIDAQQLKGYPNLWRADIGEYRIIYRFDKDILAVAIIGKRNDDEVYKKLKNKM